MVISVLGFYVDVLKTLQTGLISFLDMILCVL